MSGVLHKIRKKHSNYLQYVYCTNCTIIYAIRIVLGILKLYCGNDNGSKHRFNLKAYKVFGFLQVYVVGQDKRVPPLNVGHLPFSDLFLRGNQSELGGCLDSCLLCCLGNLVLQPFQLGLNEVRINTGQTKKQIKKSCYYIPNNQAETTPDILRFRS